MNFNRQPGRPESASPKDPYEILGVPRDATPDEIRSAYRNSAKKWHPDFHPGNKAAEEKFKAITAAYEFLTKSKEVDLFDGMTFPQSSTTSEVKRPVSGIENIKAHIETLKIRGLVNLMNQSSILTLGTEDFEEIAKAATKRFAFLIDRIPLSDAEEFRKGLEIAARAPGSSQKIYADWERIAARSTGVVIPNPLNFFRKK